MPVAKFSIKAQSENPTKTVVETRNFKMVIDEPKNLGGTDEGLNPVEVVLGALAGCLNVVGHLVAREMKIKINGIQIDIDGDLDPSKFVGKSTNERTGYKEIRVGLKVDSDADEDTLGRWIEQVEERCPVTDNLKNATPIKIALKG